MTKLGDATWFENITNRSEYTKAVVSDGLGGHHDFAPVTREIMQKAEEIRAKFPGDVDDSVVQGERTRAAYDFVKHFVYTPRVGDYFRSLDGYYQEMRER